MYPCPDWLFVLPHEVHAVFDIPDLDEHEVRHHRLERRVLVVIVVELEPGRRYIQVDRRETGQRIVVQLGDRDQRDAAQLQLACSTSADVFDAAGNLLATIERKGTLPMADVAYVQLKGSGTVNQLEITGWGEFSR